MLLCEMLVVKLNGLDVAPGMFVNPLPLLACHCSVGPGKPLPAAVNDASAPAQTLALSGSVSTSRTLAPCACIWIARWAATVLAPQPDFPGITQ